MESNWAGSARMLYYLINGSKKQHAQKLRTIKFDKISCSIVVLLRVGSDEEIKEKQRIHECSSLLGIRRITLNKAVQAQFNTTTSHLIKQWILFEFENYLIHSSRTANAELKFPLVGMTVEPKSLFDVAAIYTYP